MLFDYDFNEKCYFLGNKPHDRAGADQPFVNSTRVNILCEYFIFTQPLRATEDISQVNKKIIQNNSIMVKSNLKSRPPPKIPD